MKQDEWAPPEEEKAEVDDIDEGTIKAIADLLTDDPDIFNEMSLGTGAVAMGPGAPTRSSGTPTRKRKRKQRIADDETEFQNKSKDFHPDPVTGQPKKGEILYSDTQSDDTDDTLE
jgi:hypothetical protein